MLSFQVSASTLPLQLQAGARFVRSACARPRGLLRLCREGRAFERSNQLWQTTDPHSRFARPGKTAAPSMPACRLSSRHRPSRTPSHQLHMFRRSGRHQVAERNLPFAPERTPPSGPMPLANWLDVTLVTWLVTKGVCSREIWIWPPNLSMIAPILESSVRVISIQKGHQR